jgi:hypothetical protein
VGEVYWVNRGLHWKTKKYFFVISCFFLTRVDKLSNATRIFYSDIRIQSLTSTSVIVISKYHRKTNLHLYIHYIFMRDLEVTERHTYRLLRHDVLKSSRRMPTLQSIILLPSWRLISATISLNRHYTATRLHYVTSKKRGTFSCFIFSKYCGILHKAIINIKIFSHSLNMEILK